MVSGVVPPGNMVGVAQAQGDNEDIEMENVEEACREKGRQSGTIAQEILQFVNRLISLQINFTGRERG